jgi:hypothetical protein
MVTPPVSASPSPPVSRSSSPTNDGKASTTGVSVAPPIRAVVQARPGEGISRLDGSLGEPEEAAGPPGAGIVGEPGERVPPDALSPERLGLAMRLALEAYDQRDENKRQLAEVLTRQAQTQAQMNAERKLAKDAGGSAG